MSRVHSDWLTAYVRYASVTEAPKRMHFWAGVSALAGALRRKVWIDMKRYTWYANFYIVFVAPPGIVAKSTTADISMNLLKQVAGIKFGPDVITWPALATAFAASSESFCYNDEWYPMSAMTLVASELGNLINPTDRDMVNLYINLWDGRKSLEKVTKMAGCDTIEAPWINMVACTTPHWIVDNMPPATVGGGFTSRCIFVYADKKEAFIPFVDEVVGDDDEALAETLIHDLEYIATTLTGPMRISADARAWERVRYKQFWESAASRMDSHTLEGYAARKQTHLFKTAMVISASRGDSMEVSLEDLQLSETMLTDIEADMDKVFRGIGQKQDSVHTDRFIDYIRRKGAVKYDEAYRQVHMYFPDANDFEGIVAGAIRAGFLTLESRGDGMFLVYTKERAASPALLTVDTEIKG